MNGHVSTLLPQFSSNGETQRQSRMWRVADCKSVGSLSRGFYVFQPTTPMHNPLTAGGMSSLRRGDGEETPVAGHALQLVSAPVIELKS
jgi:hypothetical protein